MTVGKGKGFGEIALTQGDDLRTATVTATTHVECVRLHKSNYDYFVRDIQVGRLFMYMVGRVIYIYMVGYLIRWMVNDGINGWITDKMDGE